MNLSLLKVHPSAIIGGEAVPAVNLRDLHQALGSGYQFQDWAKVRIRETQADEGVDYVIQKFLNNPKGGRPQLDYTVTLDIAKEIAMLERNEKGKQVRRYFIRIEKEFRAQSTRQTAPPEVATWLMGKLLEIMPAEKLLSLLTVRHPYGSAARNGKPRIGFRRPAYVAAPHRLKDARAFQEGMVQLNLTVQLELPKLGELATAALERREA